MISSFRACDAAQIRPSVASAACAEPANQLRTFKLRARRASRATIHLVRQRSPSRTASAASMSPDWRRDLHALHAPVATRRRSRAQSRCPSAAAAACAVGAPHPLEQRVGHAHARHFVGHELGVARAFERKHAGDDRQPRVLDALQERARSSRRRRPAASRRTRRRPRPCSRTAAAPRRDSTPPDSPTRRCETPVGAPIAWPPTSQP